MGLQAVRLKWMKCVNHLVVFKRGKPWTSWHRGDIIEALCLATVWYFFTYFPVLLGTTACVMMAEPVATVRQYQNLDIIIDEKFKFDANTDAICKKQINSCSF